MTLPCKKKKGYIYNIGKLVQIHICVKFTEYIIPNQRQKHCSASYCMRRSPSGVTLKRPPVSSSPSLIQVMRGLGAPNTLHVIFTSCPSTACMSLGGVRISGGRAVEYKDKRLNVTFCFQDQLIVRQKFSYME